MTVTFVPFDFPNLKPEQQENMFKSWCRLVMLSVKEAGAHALLKYQDKGDSGMATERILQGADVWVDGCAVNVLVAMNDMLDDDVPNQSKPDERRNHPEVRAKALLESAKELDAYAKTGNLGAYEILPRPEAGDIQV
jgi:hypothetical protein